MSALPRVLVVGGGIGGVAVAHFLGERARVTLIEQETTLAYHTTGRSAALFFENYGAGPIRPLTKASRSFFESPPAGLADHLLLSPRGAMTIAAEDQLDHLARAHEEGLTSGARLERIGTDRVREICPAVLPEAAVAALWEADAADMDVAAIHQAFVRGLRRAGHEVRLDTELMAASAGAGGWHIELSNGSWEGDVIVNAAGAWGDVVAARCGIPPVGLEPRRRTAFMVSGSAASASWPLVVDVDQSFYFKPDGEQLLCSLADETPSPPCDARPEEIDVALAIERINAATTLGIRTVRSQWAGLRTFAPDRSMVIGPEPDAPGFVWLVGQGGTGIQTAPAAGELAAALTLGTMAPDRLLDAGLDVAAVAPGRLRA